MRPPPTDRPPARAEQAAHHETKKRAPAKKKSGKVQVVIEKRKAPPKYKALKVRKPTTAFMFFSKAMKDGVQVRFSPTCVLFWLPGPA